MRIGERSPVGVRAREYCQKYPEASTHGIARMLCRDFPDLFKKHGNAASAVNYYRGTMGDAHRKEAGSGIVGPRMIPEPENPEFKIVDIPDDVERWLLLYDVHAPDHDPIAIRAMLDWVSRKENRCDGIIYPGDLYDNYQISSWSHSPKKMRFSEEIKRATALIDAIDDAVQPKRTIVKLGNHDDRWDRYLRSHAQELDGVKGTTYEEIFGLKDRGIECVPRMHILRYHALHILHGDEWGGWGNQVNPARTAAVKLRACAIVGHGHQTSEHTLPSIGGTQTACWSVGCLCNLHPEYRMINDWNHGFAVLDTRRDWRIENRRISNGEVL